MGAQGCWIWSWSWILASAKKLERTQRPLLGLQVHPALGGFVWGCQAEGRKALGAEREEEWAVGATMENDGVECVEEAEACVSIAVLEACERSFSHEMKDPSHRPHRCHRRHHHRPHHCPPVCVQTG